MLGHITGEGNGPKFILFSREAVHHIRVLEKKIFLGTPSDSREFQASLGCTSSLYKSTSSDV